MKKKFIFLGLIFILGLIIYFPGRKMAREHVNYMTAATDHPLSCTSCHLSISQNKYISDWMNEDYLSPFNLAVSGDGNFLYVVAQDTDELLVVDAHKKTVTKKIKVGNHPHSVILNKDSDRAYVSNQWSDNVFAIDLKTLKVTDTLKTGNGPAGLALSSDQKDLYVVNTFGSNLSVIDLESGEEFKRLTTGNNPTGTALSPDGDHLLVTSRRPNFTHYGEPLISDMSLVSDKSKKLIRHVSMNSAYMMENVEFTPSGDLAITTLIRPKNLVTTVQVEGGWMMTHGIGIIEKGGEGRITQLLLDEPNSYYPDPFDVVISPDGKKAFVSSTGVNRISVIAIDSLRTILKNTSPEMLKRYANNLGVSSRFVIKRIATGASPKGLAVSPDGKYLYIAEQLEDRIAVVNIETLEKEEPIDLGGPKRITVARQGHRLFNNAGHTFQNQYACYTCHPDDHEDGLVYNMAGKDMGRNVTNTQSLREIAGTAPFKWNGKNQSVYKQDGMRFSTVLTRTEQFNYDDLDALVSYIMTGIKHPPNLMYNPDGKLTESQLRGKKIFDRSVDNYGNVIPENNRCITCHPAPFYTNMEMADVGTLAESDDPILFDTPHLNNLYSSAPYLHDGKAKTLEEIWTVYGGDDKHGFVSDLTKMDLNDLVDYLNSLRSPAYDTNENRDKHSSSSESN
jgi:YVTN family beta-propeller protein